MPALDLRRWVGTLVSAEGLATATDLQVAQRGAGANMSVDISSGKALVRGDVVTEQGYYLGYNDATYNLATFTAAHATLPRIDRVVLRAHDAFHGDADNTDTLAVLTGTATSGATLANLTGAAAVGNGELLLANVLVPAAATTITTGNIANVAATLRIAGAARTVTGIIPAAGTTPTAGTGFTYTHTNGTGLYVFTFSTAFTAAPVVLATPNVSGATNKLWIYAHTISTTGFSVQLEDNVAGAVDKAFNFLAYAVS